LPFVIDSLYIYGAIGWENKLAPFCVGYQWTYVGSRTNYNRSVLQWSFITFTAF